MTDFADMARSANENHQAKIDEKQKILQERAVQEKDRLSRARSALLDEVMPTLEDAHSAFSLQKINCSIEENDSFSHITNRKIWLITFRCCKMGEVGTVRAGVITCGDRVRFEHDGQNLTIVKDLGRGSSTRYRSVTEAIEHALNSLFENLSPG